MLLIGSVVMAAPADDLADQFAKSLKGYGKHYTKGCTFDSDMFKLNGYIEGMVKYSNLTDKYKKKEDFSEAVRCANLSKLEIEHMIEYHSEDMPFKLRIELETMLIDLREMLKDTHNVMSELN